MKSKYYISSAGTLCMTIYDRAKPYPPLVFEVTGVREYPINCFMHKQIL